MKPGVYPDLSNEEYHAAEGWSSTRLKQAEMSVTLAEQRGLYQFDTSSLSLGQVVHTLVLEPEKAEEELAVMPPFNLRTKAGKEEKAEFYKENGHKLILKAEEFDQASAMANSVLAIYGETLQGCQSEISVFAEDENGLLRKCRPDSLCASRKVIFDLKTSREDIDAFGRRAIYTYDYDLSAAWYLDTCNLAGLEIEEFAFVVVSSTKPYYSFGYLATGELLESGRQKCQALLDKIHNKKEHNIDTLFHKAIVPEWRQAQMTGGY